MDTRLQLQNAVFNLEITLDKLSSLYALFSAEYIDTAASENKATIEQRAAIGCIIFDLINAAVANIEEITELTKE